MAKVLLWQLKVNVRSSSDGCSDAKLTNFLPDKGMVSTDSLYPVDKKDIQDVEQSGEANIYDPQGRAVKLTFSGIAVGDVVELTWKLTRRLNRSRTIA